MEDIWQTSLICLDINLGSKETNQASEKPRHPARSMTIISVELKMNVSYYLLGTFVAYLCHFKLHRTQAMVTSRNLN